MPNKNNRRRRRNKARRKLRFRSYTNRDKRYMTVLNSRTQTFGAGSQFLVITRNVGITADTIQYYKVSDVLTSSEWPKVENEWFFFKIEKIVLIFMPRNNPSSLNQDPLYVNVNFKAGDVEQPSIQDNTRIVFPYLIKPRILRYVIPHVSIDSVVLNAWLSKADFLIAAENIVFSFSAPGNQTEWNVRFELGLACRGPTSPQEAKVLLGVKQDSNEDKNEVSLIKNEIRKLRRKLKEIKINQSKKQENKVEDKEKEEENDDSDWFSDVDKI